MKLYIIRINGGLHGCEAVCFAVVDGKIILSVIKLPEIVASPQMFQLLFLNEEEKKVFKEFQLASDAAESLTLKGLTFKEWSKFLDTRLGCFIQPKPLDLF